MSWLCERRGSCTRLAIPETHGAEVTLCQENSETKEAESSRVHLVM